jgi:glycosyltransferase involved in cell wall biosynthesis
LERINIFVLPEDHGSPSGGNLYNLFLLDALRKEGFPFKVMNLELAFRHSRTNRTATYWIDSLYFGRLADLRRKINPLHHVFLVIHHIPSLYPHLNREDAAKLREFEQTIFHGVTGFLVTSPFTKKVLEKRKILDKPIFTVPPALCLSPPIKRRRKKEGFKGLIVSNIIQGKGVLEFLKSLAPILTRSDLFAIQIAGRLDIDPEYAKACLELVEKKPEMKQSVYFLGPLDKDRLKELYEKSTLFLSPSKMETFGMAIREALAFGLPVFAYAAEYSRKLINPGKNGYLFPSLDDLAQGCLRMIREPDKLIKLNLNSYQNRLVTKYTWKDASRLFLRQFQKWQSLSKCEES